MTALQRIEDFINAELQLIADEAHEARADEQLALLQEEEDAMYEEMYRRYQYDDCDGPWYWEL